MSQDGHNPGGARSLLEKPLTEITDERAEIHEITPDLCAATDRLLADPTINPQVLQNWLMEVAKPKRQFSLVQEIRRIVMDNEGNVRVGEISDGLGISRQYLNRLVNDHVGVDLKTFQRIIRMRLLTDRLRQSSRQDIDWADLAAEHGFYDQSHFIHDFKEVVGLLPSEFLK